MANGLRPPKLRAAPVLKRGPEFLHVPKAHVGGFGDPPTGFLGHRNSKSEWPPYAALAVIFRNPLNYREPPFDGGWPDWTYQNPTRSGAGITGSVVDFVVNPPGRSGKPIAIRIQTEWLHIFADNQKHAYDAIQRVELERYAEVVDIYDQDYLWDQTGQTIVILMKQALGLIERPNPVTSRTGLRATRLVRELGP